MAFEKTVPSWNAPGAEPPSSLKNSGFQAGYKPPADYFNWFWYGVSKALTELQNGALDKDGDTMTGNLALKGAALNVLKPDTTGGWARGMNLKSVDGSENIASVGFQGEKDVIGKIYLGFGAAPYEDGNGLAITEDQVSFKGHEVYHEGHKPTPSELGMYSNSELDDMFKLKAPYGATKHPTSVKTEGWLRVLKAPTLRGLIVNVGHNFGNGGPADLMMAVSTHGQAPAITVLLSKTSDAPFYTKARLVKMADGSVCLDVYYSRSVENIPVASWVDFKITENKTTGMGFASVAEVVDGETVILTQNIALIPSGNVLTDGCSLGDYGAVMKKGDTMTGTLVMKGVNVNIYRPDTTGGWARGMNIKSADGATDLGGVRFYGDAGVMSKIMLATSGTDDTQGLAVAPDFLMFNGNKFYEYGSMYAGTQTPSTYLVRNQKLSTTEETPTVNGEICWQCYSE